MAGRSDRVLVFIGAFKLVKCALLLIAGFVALRLVRGDPAETIQSWASHVRFDPHNRYFNALLFRVARLDPKNLEAIGVGTFVYAAVFAIEGVGLAMRKRWAEYLTIAITASFLPLEIYELVRRTSVPRILTIAANIAIVAYLTARVRRERSAAG